MERGANYCMGETINNYLNNYIFPTNTNDFDIPDSILKEWQSIVELLARMGGASTGLIMRVQNGEIEVLVASNQPSNPYQVGNKEPLLNSGLYCETVIQTDEKLFVPNALKSIQWQNNPDMKYNMLNYLGFPIKLPNGKPFGTICILDNKENNYSTDLMQLMKKMSDLIEAHLKLLYLSFHDSLTGIYNRTFFKIKAAEKMKQAKHHKQPITILLLDVDKFKHINDTYGHLAGDEVLKEIVNIINSSIRCSDTIARYGGEEFMLLMPDTAISEAMTKAEEIRVKVENSQNVISEKITISIGIAEWLLDESLEDWFKRADTALFQAKESGRNQVCFS